MNFYALPNEFSAWLEGLLADDKHWILMKTIRPKSHTLFSGLQSAAEAIRSISSVPPHGPYFYIGNKEFRERPLMEQNENGTEDIRFLDSLCVRFVPSFLIQDTLLEGYLDAFGPSRYKDRPNGEQFLSWKAKLSSSLKRVVFKNHGVTTQLVNDGSIKRWNNVLVSQGVLDWFSDGKKLKQYEDSDVEFTPVRKNGSAL